MWCWQEPEPSSPEGGAGPRDAGWAGRGPGHPQDIFFSKELGDLMDLGAPVRPRSEQREGWERGSKPTGTGAAGHLSRLMRGWGEGRGIQGLVKAAKQGGRETEGAQSPFNL